MTLEEAIHRLETHKEYISPHGRFTEEAIDMAIEALEKQIPKEPTWRCPSCNAPYEEDEKYHYCPSCGQRLDVGEEED